MHFFVLSCYPYHSFFSFCSMDVFSTPLTPIIPLSTSPPFPDSFIYSSSSFFSFSFLSLPLSLSSFPTPFFALIYYSSSFSSSIFTSFVFSSSFPRLHLFFFVLLFHLLIFLSSLPPLFFPFHVPPHFLCSHLVWTQKGGANFGHGLVPTLKLYHEKTNGKYMRGQLS
uniref:Uncharacterized protein n=1 Tax=Cacopsylla melanoneura TaxID=428564 RepID=A0A8D9F510_9HEMI